MTTIWPSTVSGTATATGAETAGTCPRCQQSNHCALAAGGGIDYCWCQHASIPASLREGVGDEPRCLCPACAGTLQATDN